MLEENALDLLYHTYKIGGQYVDKEMGVNNVLWYLVIILPKQTWCTVLQIAALKLIFSLIRVLVVSTGHRPKEINRIIKTEQILN